MVDLPQPLPPQSRGIMVAFGDFLWYDSRATQVNMIRGMRFAFLFSVKMQALFWHTSFAYVELVWQQGACVFRCAASCCALFYFPFHGTYVKMQARLP